MTTTSGEAAAAVRRSSYYRPDIDGLRSIAVLSVVLFHFSHAWMPGGFLGVDVFFVISGFLITSILVRETGAGTYSVLKFYERRIRRIAPALLVFLAVTTAAAIALLLPLDLAGYSKSMLAGLGFVANFYFWRDGNYFARASENKPLLHIWTLSVEEQFYIFFPLLILLMVRRPDRLQFWVVAAIAAVSLALNIAALRTGAKLPAFYLLPTRAWELGAGSLIAMAPMCRLAAMPRLAMAGAGLLLILAGIAAAPTIVPSPLPEPLPAVIGAALLIWSGTSRQTGVHRVLSWPIPVAIGLISYSLYLWHWPVVVFYRYYTFNDFTLVTAAIAFAVIMLLATLSWKFVEQPFRGKRISSRNLVLSAVGGALVLAAVGGATILSKGFPGRLSPEVQKLNAAIGSNWRCPLSKFTLYGARNSCLLSTDSVEEADVVLLGNSHAQMYAPLISEIFAEQSKKVLLIPANGCLPVLKYNISANCVHIAETNLEAAAALPAAKEVVIAFTWHTYPGLVDRQGVKQTDGRQALIDGLDEAIARLQQSGKIVRLVGPIQIPGYDYPSIWSRAIAFNRNPHEPMSLPAAQFNASMGPLIAYYTAREDITFITPHQIQCATGECRFSIDGLSLFADTNHVSADALGLFRPAFERAMTQVGHNPGQGDVHE